MSDSTELATVEAGRAVAVPTSSDIVQSILHAACDKDIDADKVKTLTELATGMIDRERAAQFNAAKIAAIREMPAIYKRGKSDKHRYAKFEDLHRAVMPVLARHALGLDFKVGSEGNLITVQPVLRHDNGWVEEGGIMKGPADTGPGRSPIQAIGSSTSYLKRHSMKAMLNIIEDGEDDDGSGYGTRDGEQRNDRQERLVVDAEAALARGEYAQWYGTQKAGDKAWLVRAGVHARLGGGAALPPPVSSSPVGQDQRPEPEPEDAEFSPAEDEPLPPPETKQADPPKAHDVTTPEGWTAKFKDDLAAAKDLSEVAAIEKRGATGLKRLSDGHAKLWEQADAALLDAKDRLAGTASDLFPGDK
jgi:hypothetical protein